MSEYVVVAGDTFASVSRKRFGVPSQAGLIAQANPGASDPLVAGTVLSLPLPVRDRAVRYDSGAADEVSLLINGDRFRFWDSVRIARAVDSIDTIEFSAPFDPSAPSHRETFRPFTFAPAEFLVGGERLFTGTVVSVRPLSTDALRTVQVGGYATAGVVADCTPSPSSDLEFNGATLQGIASSLCAPLGVQVEFPFPTGAPFERVACKATRNLLSFLTPLAQQRGGAWGSNTNGALRFSRTTPAGEPVARLVEGVAPLLEASAVFSEQKYFSHVTGIERVGTGTSGSRFTVKNPRLNPTRPHTFEVEDAIGGDVQTATRAKTSRMFSSAVAYQVRVATWRTPGGRLWAPDMSVSLISPGAMVYSEYKFKVRSVVFEASGDARVATLMLVLPGAFDGELPEALPWD